MKKYNEETTGRRNYLLLYESNLAGATRTQQNKAEESEKNLKKTENRTDVIYIRKLNFISWKITNNRNDRQNKEINFKNIKNENKKNVRS